MPVLDAVPVKLADVLDPAWLSAALGDIAEDEQVVESRVIDSSTTMASKVRFEAVVQRADGTRAVRHYCVKAYFGEAGRVAEDLQLEARFYRDVGPVVDVRMPRAAYASTDEATGRSVIILEDIVANGGTLLTALTPYPTETIEGTLAQLAHLHAATWGEGGRAKFAWVPSLTAVAEFPTALAQELLNDGRGPDLPPYLRDAVKVKAARERLSDQPPVCVAHGDAHSGNAYLDRDSQAGWYDFGCVHRGHWATDVSYHIGTALDTDTRRRHEKGLLQHYLDELARLGQVPPSWDEAWEQYGLHFAHGYFMWAITRFHSRAVVLEHIPRLGNAIVDHDTFERLGV